MLTSIFRDRNEELTVAFHMQRAAIIVDLQTCVTSGTCAVRCPRQEPAPLSDHSPSHPSPLLGRWLPPQTPAHTHTPVNVKHTCRETGRMPYTAETFAGIKFHETVMLPYTLANNAAKFSPANIQELNSQYIIISTDISLSHLSLLLLLQYGLHPLHEVLHDLSGRGKH